MQSAYGLLPCRCRGSDVSTTRVPREIGDTVVLPSGQQRHIRSRLHLLPVRVVVSGKIEIVKLHVEFGRHTHTGESDVSTPRRPGQHVGDLAFESAYRSEIALLGIPSVEGKGIFDGNTRCLYAEVWVVRRDNGESLAIRLPREGRDKVLVLNDFDRNVILSQAENFEVARSSLLGLGFSGVTVDLNA